MRFRILAAAAAAAIVVLSGCATPGGGIVGRSSGHCDLELTGVLVKVGSSYSHVSLAPGGSGIKIARGSTLQAVRDNYCLVMHARCTDGCDRDFNIILGADASTPGGVAELVYGNDPDTDLLLLDGWMYATGDMPMGGTERVIAAADGTALILQRLHSAIAVEDNAILLHITDPMKPVKVGPKGGGVEKTLSVPNTYVKYPGWIGPDPLPASLQAFVDSVKALALQAGIPPPP